MSQSQSNESFTDGSSQHSKPIKVWRLVDGNMEVISYSKKCEKDPYMTLELGMG